MRIYMRVLLLFTIYHYVVLLFTTGMDYLREREAIRRRCAESGLLDVTRIMSRQDYLLHMGHVEPEVPVVYIVPAVVPVVHGVPSNSMFKRKRCVLLMIWVKYHFLMCISIFTITRWFMRM